MATPLFNIDLLAFDTFILAVRTTDNKIIMRLDSDGSLWLEKNVGVKELGFYDRENNKIIEPTKDD